MATVVTTVVRALITLRIWTFNYQPRGQRCCLTAALDSVHQRQELRDHALLHLACTMLPRQPSLAHLGSRP